ncbi:MAG: arylesterase [Cytophagales bacterium]|nr:arylesterase [Bernardetiaceae bacterium]MDW8205578.1 arylesterase [Cytophagales bacterium]
MHLLLRVLCMVLTGFFAGCTSPEQTQENNGIVTADSSHSTAAVAQDNRKIILFFGNSLTAGFGLEPEQAFPALIQLRIDSLGLPYRCINAGVSGETTASGNTRIDWMLEQPVDILVIELGGNDGLRGISPEETRKNLQSIISKAKTKYPAIKIVLAGMEVPPNMGQTYAAAFRKIYPELAQTNQLTLIPFLLDKVGGEPSLNLPDGIHPTAEGHRIVAETVWKYLQTLLTPAQ